MNKENKTGSIRPAGRSNLFKLLAKSVLAAFTTLLIGGFFLGNTVSANANSKILIVYFSRSGNTGQLARQIQQNVGGDILQIETVNDYPQDYNAATRQARQELDSGFRPELKPIRLDIASYETIFVGSPNWWGSVAPPIMTFLQQYDFSGKKIVPFITHGGSGLGRSVTDIRRLCPDAEVLDALAVRGGSAGSSQNEVADWLRQLSI